MFKLRTVVIVVLATLFFISSVFVFYYNRPTKTGLVLVQKNSGLEEISKEIAAGKGWRFVSIVMENNHIDFAKKVKQKIVEEYTKEKFNYLLIVGTDKNIPLLDSNWDIFSSESLGEEQVPVLDSLYYGDVDDDGFIELAVGRLPFSSAEDVSSYFNELKTEGEKVYLVSATNAGYQFCECELEEVVFDCSCDAQEICLSETFGGVYYEANPDKEEISKMLQESKYFSIFTHGDRDLWCLGDWNEWCPRQFYASELPNMGQNKPVVLSSACLTAQHLGVEALRKGAVAFIGSYPEGAIEGEGYTFATYLLGGESIGNSFKEHLNLAIANKIVRDSRYGDILNIDVKERVTPSGYTYVLYGDPSLELPKSVVKLNKISFKKEDEKIKILIQPPHQMILNDVVVNCYGKNVQNIPIFYKDNYNQTVAADKVLTIGLKVDIEKIEEAHITIGNEEYIDLSKINPSKDMPILSIVKGRGESYLILNLLINEFKKPILVEIE
jgi:hypothetical protein